MLPQRLVARLSLLAPTIRQLMETPPEPHTKATARGHIKALRTFKNVGFMDLSDGSGHGTLSVIVSDPGAVFAAHQYKVGQSVEVTGRWAPSRGRQPFELACDTQDPAHGIAVLGDVAPDYPIQKKRHTLAFLRSAPTLRHRTALLSSVLRMRARAEAAVAAFFLLHDVVKVAPPLITASDCEGAGEQFQVRPLGESTADGGGGGGFFGTAAYLTVSTQLHLEVLALSLNRVWTLTPCFRAETSNTPRHLSEFWMLEAELCYVTSVGQLTAFVEQMVRHVVAHLAAGGEWAAGAQHDLLAARHSRDDVARIRAAWAQVLLPAPWPSVTYSEALETLNALKYKGRLQGRLAWGAPLLTEDEKWLAGCHYQLPVFVTDYPKAQKPFYMRASGDAARPTVACFDLLVPELGELVGGSLREHDLATLEAEMASRGMLRDAMRWYLSTRENGSVPHGGFGMGFERLLAYLAAVDNIRDISAFPRAPNVCAC
ncbi:asparaginyl-tRNA synthetase [Metschnikowia bicuspidata var. bicuspidata NRRL YB-4993]|uniref:asparagine--tRNA ligase n=1 Tax=Metschnikowia bicuspidata var. bicuspidata NRRL YB-4993 TaxID=869754 RepID=A0A1A0H8U3_9ASCO|nr:asparaginyl-tRNA synthetase [Metschnikowia bicuspidata var. bicuspidata NRRL YB-4993]OBA20302.1 asparaginyl-tRNA synthetase [Metschnikowia bicuspidata var. bicuspidata NRRL YB-4993]